MSELQKNLRETNACMKRIAMDTKGCVQLTSNDTHFSDSWFSGVETDQDAMAAGVDSCGTAKTIHKGFCLATLEKLIRDCTGGSYLVMNITTRVPVGIPLLGMVYQ